MMASTSRINFCLCVSTFALGGDATNRHQEHYGFPVSDASGSGGAHAAHVAASVAGFKLPIVTGVQHSSGGTPTTHNMTIANPAVYLPFRHSDGTMDKYFSTSSFDLLFSVFEKLAPISTDWEALPEDSKFVIIAGEDAVTVKDIVNVYQKTQTYITQSTSLKTDAERNWWKQRLLFAASTYSALPTDIPTLLDKVFGPPAATGITIDRAGDARWLGQNFRGDLSFMGYPPLYEEHLADVRSNLSTLKGTPNTDTYTIFKPNTSIISNYGNGATQYNAVTLNKVGKESVEKLVIDFRLGCLGDGLNELSSCPVWDHVVQLLVCCNKDPSDTCEPYTQGHEIGRWITPFRRGIGHWISDVTALSPMVFPPGASSNQVCNFTTVTRPAGSSYYPMNHKWTAATDLIVVWKKQQEKEASEEPQASKAAVRVAREPAPEREILYPWPNYGQNGNTLPNGPTFSVFHWYIVTKKYADNFPAFAFPPASALPGHTQARVVAYMTGHGGDDNSCTEFCATVHRYTVTNTETKEVVATLWANFTLPLTNSDNGCWTAEKVHSGVVPNEHGTWGYGRNGWCDGRNVDLYESDPFALPAATTAGTSSKYALLSLTYTAFVCLSLDDCTPYEQDMNSTFPANLLVNIFVALE